MIYWFFLQTKTMQHEPKKIKPQEYMYKIQVTNYNEDGQPKEILHADYWEFKPSVGCSDLLQPFLTVYKPNGEMWYLSAKHALAWHTSMSDKITKIDMLDDVVIERPEINQATPVILKTLALQYIPDEEKISTKEFVSMQQPGLTISGYGLLGFLDRNWIELHDKITTIYTPR